MQQRKRDWWVVGDVYAVVSTLDGRGMPPVLERGRGNAVPAAIVAGALARNMLSSAAFAVLWL